MAARRKGVKISFGLRLRLERDYKWSYIIGGFLFLFSFVIYVRTLVPWVLPNDSGEFQVLSFQLGLAHTPGYPIYLVLAKLFTYVPVSTIAYRVNLFSAFMASVSIALLYGVGFHITGNKFASVIGACVLMLSPAFWSQAVVAEVYTTAIAFIGAIILCLVLWYRQGDNRLLFLAGLLGGMSLGVHFLVGLMLPGIVLFLFLSSKTKWTVWKIASVGLILGIVVWFAAFLWLDHLNPPANIFNSAYVPSRSAWNLSAAEMDEFLIRFWFLASGRQWQSALSFSVNTFFQAGMEYLYLLPSQFVIATLLFAALGLGVLWRLDWAMACLISVILVVHYFVVFNYHIGDIKVYYLAGYFFISVLSIIGISQFFRFVNKKLESCSSLFKNRILSIVTLITALVCILPILKGQARSVLIGNSPFVDNSVATMASTASEVIQNLEPDAVVLLPWKWLYIYYYIAQIELDRNDLVFIEPNHSHENPGFPVSLVEMLSEDIYSHPIYTKAYFPELEEKGFTLEPVEIGPEMFFRVELSASSKLP